MEIWSNFKFLFMVAIFYTATAIPNRQNFAVNLQVGDVQAALNWLRNYGRSRLAAGTNQYIAAMVVSDNELRNWQANGAEGRLQNRLMFVPNSQNSSGRAIHGEKILLESHVNNMVSTYMGNPNPQANPIVVIYSHYIPCSSIANTPVECAARLMEWMLKDQQRNTRMVVGYDESYVEQNDRGRGWRARTNEKRSQWYMRLGGIAVFHRTGGGGFTKPLLFVPATNNDNVLQRWIYECLVGLHMTDDKKRFFLQHGVNAPTCVTGERLEFFFSYFINYMLYQCVQSPSGPTNKNALKSCMQNHIRNNARHSCPEYRPTWNEKHVQLCSDFALDNARSLGRPEPYYWRNANYPGDNLLSQVQLTNNWVPIGEFNSGQLLSDLRQWYVLTMGTVWTNATVSDRQLQCIPNNSREDLKLLCKPSSSSASGRRRPSPGGAKRAKWSHA